MRSIQRVWLQPVLGPLADALGRRKVMLMGGAVFALATLGRASASSVQARSSSA